MSDMSGTPDPLKEVVEQMKRDAFAAGWKAAVEAMTGALTNLERPDGTDSAVPPAGTLANTWAVPEPAPATTTVGTTPHYVFEAVRRKQGMTGAQVVEAVHGEGHDVGEAQIRTALSRLEKRLLLVNRHKKWFLR
jgi:hypothetical protein